MASADDVLLSLIEAIKSDRMLAWAIEHQKPWYRDGDDAVMIAWKEATDIWTMQRLLDAIHQNSYRGREYRCRPCQQASGPPRCPACLAHLRALAPKLTMADVMEAVSRRGAR